MAKAKAKTSRKRLKADNTQSWQQNGASSVRVCVCVSCHDSRRMKAPVRTAPKTDREREMERERERVEKSWEEKLISRCDFAI